MVELATKIRKQMVAAINDFHMIAPGDQVLVAVSGGKDSAILLKLLIDIQNRAKNNFKVRAVILDQKQPGFNLDAFAKWVSDHCGIVLEVIEQDTYSIVKEKIEPGKTFCGLCSRLRRGILYNYAFENNCNKLALGHHRDDLNETAVMNMFFSGSLASMPPKLRSDDGRNCLIRPLVYTAEGDLEVLSRDWEIPIIPCNLCGSQENLRRKQIKLMLNQWSQTNPNLGQSILKALGNVKTSQLLDPKLQDFSGL